MPLMTDGPITEPNRDLIQGLLLEAGRIMEDLSPDLALVLPASITAVRARVDRVHQAGEDILALASAMRRLLR